MSIPTVTAAVTAQDIENNINISEVEIILNYTFKDKKLLVEALTHSSYTESTSSYQRLEFRGDAVLNLVIANWSFSEYPTIDEHILHILRRFNASNRKLACAAIRLGLDRYVLCNGLCLDDSSQEFSLIVEALVKTGVCGGTVNPPKVLADIVESTIGAIYQDSEQNMKLVWEVIKGLLEPLITLETLPLQLMATGNQQDFAELKAVCDALEKHKKSANDMNDEIIDRNEIEYAVMKLRELCVKNKWPEPSYERIEPEMDLGNEKKFKHSVMIKIEDVEWIEMGAAKSKVKKARNAAASRMIHLLEKYNLI